MRDKMHLVCPHCNATNRVPADKLQAELNCGSCHASLLNAHPDNLGEVAFNAQLAKSDLPVVVDFWAPWCGPCKQLAPAFDRLAGKYGNAKVAFAKVDIEKVGEVATILQVSSIPMIAVFTHGKISDKIQGANLTQIESVVRFREAHL